VEIADLQVRLLLAVAVGADNAAHSRGSGSALQNGEPRYCPVPARSNQQVHALPAGVTGGRHARLPLLRGWFASTLPTRLRSACPHVVSSPAGLGFTFTVGVQSLPIRAHLLVFLGRHRGHMRNMRALRGGVRCAAVPVRRRTTPSPASAPPREAHKPSLRTQPNPDTGPKRLSLVNPDD